MEVLVVLLLGCGGLDGTPPPSGDGAAIPDLAVEGPIWTAPITTASRPVPERYRQPLADLPPAYAADRLCYGDDALRTAFLAAGAWASAPPCVSPSWCAWVAEAAPDEAGALGPLADCADPAHAALFTLDDPEAVLRYYERRRYAEVHLYDPVVLEAGRILWPSRPALALRVLGAFDHEDVAAQLMAWGDADPRVDLSLYAQSDALAQRRFRQACRAHPSEPRCHPEYLKVVQQRDPLADLDATVRGPDPDIPGLAARHPSYADAVRAAANRCVQSAVTELETNDWVESFVARQCLLGLAELDRPAAVRAAERLTDAGVQDFPVLAPSVALLLRYPEADGLAALFAEHDIAVGEGVDPAALLSEAGHGFSFARVAQHRASILRRLAALGGAKGVFDVRTPTSGYATLWAWHRNQRHRALARLDAADVGQLVGFVNAVLAEQKAPDRIVVVDRGDGELVAIAGPPALLAALHDDGLLWIAEPLAVFPWGSDN